jgi:hypothetical protein
MIGRLAASLPTSDIMRYGEMREWRRSRINRAAHDLPPGWVGRPHSNRHSLIPRLSPAQPGGGRHTYVAKRSGVTRRFCP